jgi:hypothetical protein
VSATSAAITATADPLAALLVREGILPAARVEEAQERMVLSGGTLDTAILELGLLDEPRLLDLLPRAYRVRAVGHSELDGIDKSIASHFPRRLAEKHSIVPIEVSGRRIRLALAGPPDLPLLDEIGFILSVYVEPAVTTQARVAAALARLYGIPVPSRLEVLVAPGLALAAVDAASEMRDAASGWQARTSHARRADPVPSAPDAPTSPPPESWQIAHGAVLPFGAPSSPQLALEDGGSLEARAIAGERAAEGRSLDEQEKRRRTRVLWSVDDAIAELALADGRDAMLDVVLRFAYRRLSTVAVFIYVRGKDGSEPSFVSWDVIDPLLARHDIAAFALPAASVAGQMHALGQVLEVRSPFLGPLREDDPLVRLFGRRPRAVLALPILVGDRFAGVLYGDCGSKPIPPSSVAELHMVVPRLGKGLGNLILRNKKALRAVAVAPAVRARLGGAPRVLSAAELREVEEDMAVSAPAPARAVPTIDLGAVAAPVAGFATAPSAPWADGQDDDDDVRVDEALWAELDAIGGDAPAPAATAPRQSASTTSTRTSTAKVEPVASVQAAHATSRAAPIAMDDDPTDHIDEVIAGFRVESAHPRSPGAHAKEPLLLATHAAWLTTDDAVLDDLVGQLHRPDEAARRAALHAVTSHGDRAMPSLARYFPGVLAVHPFAAMESRPAVVELSDCIACLTELGPDCAAPILVAELSHDDRLHRWAAVWSLSAIHVPGALPRLAQRVFDAEPLIAALALEVLEAYRKDAAFDNVLAQVRDLVRRGDPFERQRGILAVTELKDRDALPALVDLLGTRPEEIAEAARHALTMIAKQDFGTAERRWRAWIADNQGIPRTRWLIDGLSSKADDIRRSAQQEVQRLTGQLFGYRWDAARTEREESVVAWEKWWSAQLDGRWP